MENLSKRALRIGIIAGSMCICTAAYAAIPVIDDQNILQQLKTYEETVKVVTNTKEQISLQLKELEKLPSHILNGYKQTLENGREDVYKRQRLSRITTILIGIRATACSAWPCRCV